MRPGDIDLADPNNVIRFEGPPNDYFEMLRRHAAGNGEDGNFRKLIEEVSWSEAMIKMLDLDESSAGEINENFGRELLELFTLGVDGGYTEADVGAAAEAECEQYLRGFTDALILAGAVGQDAGICLPEQNRDDEVRWAYMYWVNQNYDRREEPAAHGLMDTLKARFPCN